MRSVTTGCESHLLSVTLAGHNEIKQLSAGGLGDVLLCLHVITSLLFFNFKSSKLQLLFHQHPK